MDNKAVRITEKDLIYDTFQKRFTGGKIYIKSSDLNIEAESFSFSDGIITLSCSRVNACLDGMLLYVRDGDEVIFSRVKLVRESGKGIFEYEPLDIQILQMPRREERKSVGSIEKSEAPRLYITGIISDFSVNDCINSSRRRADAIKDELIKKLQNVYSNSEIVFLNDKMKDFRMLYLKKERKPLYIRNLKDVDDPEKVRTDEDLKFYKTYILPGELSGLRGKIVSEICVPLLYKMMLPFGYVRTSSLAELTEQDFSAIRKFGMSASTVYTNDKQIIVSSDDRIAVTDMSLSGLGIFFKEKTLIKHFKEESLIIFTLILPDKKQATMLCEVKNISLIKNYIYRIGCEILNIEALGEVNYTEYLETAGHEHAAADEQTL